MTQTTDEQQHADAGPCPPLGVDFDRLAASIAAAEDTFGPLPTGLDTVEHCLQHLREETGLHDKAIARVLLTAGFLLGDIAREAGPRWNSTATANWLALCGLRLWDAEPPPGVLTRLAHGLGIGRQVGDDQPQDRADA